MGGWVLCRGLCRGLHVGGGGLIMGIGGSYVEDWGWGDSVRDGVGMGL